MCDETFEITRVISAGDSEGIRVFIAPVELLPVADRKSGIVLSADDFAALLLKVGSYPIETLNVLIDASRRYGARRAALRMLSVGICNRKKLAQKLRQKGFSPEHADFAALDAAERGYIDEHAQIESYLRVYVENRNYGPRRILPALLARGYDASDISDCFNAYSRADFSRAKKRFLLKKFGKEKPENAEEARKMRAALYKQGF